MQVQYGCYPEAPHPLRVLLETLATVGDIVDSGIGTGGHPLNCWFEVKTTLDRWAVDEVLPGILTGPKRYRCTEVLPHEGKLQIRQIALFE